jgi:hypothetical protein
MSGRGYKDLAGAAVVMITARVDEKNAGLSHDPDYRPNPSSQANQGQL